MADKEMKNIKAVQEFRLRGKKVVAGEVVSKDDFANAGDWKNICNMNPERAVETNDPVGKPGAKATKTATKLPGTD